MLVEEGIFNMKGDTLETALQKASERREITNRLKRVLIERLTLQFEPDEISEDSPLFGLGLGLDSVDALEIVVGVEREFGVSITDEDMHAFRSINTVVDFIITKQLEGIKDESKTIR